MCCDLTHTHTPTEAGRQADTHAGYGIHLSSYVCAIINKSEIARLQTPRSEYQTSGAEEGGRLRLSGALKEGDPNRQPEEPTARTAVTATRATLQQRLDNNNERRPIQPEQLNECDSSAR